MLKLFKIRQPAILLGGFIALLLSSCQWWEENPDNIAEEIVEEVIEKELHVEVDLSPSSIEKSSTILPKDHVVPHHTNKRKFSF